VNASSIGSLPETFKILDRLSMQAQDILFHLFYDLIIILLYSVIDIGEAAWYWQERRIHPW
jgi:hypothetical protein